MQTLFVLAALSEVVFSHCFAGTQSLDGAWEMAYQPYEYAAVCHILPSFEGRMVENAVPGYWEDLFSLDDKSFGVNLRVQPLYHIPDFPLMGERPDMTLPNIYGCFFYRRNFNVDNDGPALLRFEGVRNQVHIWVNGRFVAFRQGYSTPFEIKIPDGILRKGENTIVMAVSNNPNLGYRDFVTGLTTRAVFGGTGGVNGHLELAFPHNDLGDVYVTTAADLKSFTVHVSGQSRYDWEIPGVGKGSAEGDFTLPTEGLRLWSDTDPFLYTLNLRSAGKLYSRKFGIRRLQAKGESLFLNGRPVYLRGVTEHCYYPLTVHIPRDLEYYRMVASKRKALGFNFVRFHTHVPPEEYLQACDEAGMMVHIESPNFVDIPEYEAIIAFARSHPSVVIYCTGNETRIDAVAEAYLEEIANRVHTMSDALFSPMSALRGMEYILLPGYDSTVSKPWPHNPERFKRVGRFADIYTTYQNSATSYEAINSPYTAAVVDVWGGVYGKPRLAHEICIDGTYVDFTTEQKYPAGSPIIRTGMFDSLRRVLNDKGLLDKAELYYRNSCEWQRRCRKFCFEKIRSMKRTCGYDFLGDINTHWHTFGYSVGMMDEFYNLKWSETRENVLRYNSAAVLLCDLGSDFNFRSGETRRVEFSISNFDAVACKFRAAGYETLDNRNVSGGTLSVSLVAGNGRKVFSKTTGGLSSPLGAVSVLASVDVKFPSLKKPASYILKAEYICNGLRVANEWEVYSFPETDGPLAAGPVVLSGIDSIMPGVKVVENISRDSLLAAMATGETVAIFGAGPFKSLKASFQCGLPGRSDGNAATVIKSGHPALGAFPHKGFCGWQFRRLMQGADAVQLEAGIPFDPVIDVASAVKCPIRQSFLFEYKVGKGRLLVCSLVFNDHDPAASYLKSCLLSYLASDSFCPSLSLTCNQLAAVIDAPLIDGGRNTNRASNVNDPSSAVGVPLNPRVGRY